MLRGSSLLKKDKSKDSAVAPAASAEPASSSSSVILDEASLSQETETITPEEGADGESDAGKLKQLLSVLKKVVGVKDLANLRLSLPANLLEPKGNLEWWHYLDRPDLFAAIGQKDIDPLTRFIAVTRWTFSKELRHVRGRVCKPYNSALGEQFRCVWEVSPAAAHEFQVYHDLLEGMSDGTTTTSESPSPALSATTNGKALPSSMSNLSLNETLPAHKRKTSSVAGSSASSVVGVPAAGNNRKHSPLSSGGKETCRVAFINEQVCHHPPISAFWYESTPSETRAAVQATGIDHLAAKFNGTSVKIGAGASNKGIFVKIPGINKKEEYQITHQDAYITGFISRAPYITMSDHTFISTIPAASPHVATSADMAAVPSSSSSSSSSSSRDSFTSSHSQSVPTPIAPGMTKQYRAIIQYNEESWITKPRFLVEGLIHEYDGTPATEYMTLKKCPESAVVARIKGNWKGKITIKMKNEKTESVLLDMSQLDIVQKCVRPLEKQDPMETRRFWEPVTNSILKKDYKQATTHKQTIEQAQRDKAAFREKMNDPFVPALFDADIANGRGKLTTKGRKALQEEFEMQHHA